MDSGKRALVVETLNKLLSSSNAKAKVQHVEQLEELLLRNEPALLDEFLSEMVPLQMDKAVSVRRKLLEFVAAAVRVRPSPAVLSTAAPCVTGLLSDEQAQLAREAAQAAHVLLTRGLIMLAAAPQGDAAAGAAWGLVQGLQRDLSNMAASLSGSHGGSSSRQLAMCLSGIKMAEQAVLHYTAATQASMQLLPVAAALASEVQRLGQLLVQLVDVATVKQRAGPVVIAAVKGLGCCCMQRQQLLPALLPPLLTLAEQGVFKAPRADEQQSGVAASCGAALQDTLVRLYRSSSSEAAKPWRQKLHTALVALGAEAAAASAQRHLERQAVRAREGHKRKAADQAGRDAKQARPTTPAADSSAGNTPTRTPTPGPGATPSSGGGVEMPTDLMALFRPGPGVNMGEALNNAQQVLEVLVQAQQEEAVQAILACVAPEVLAELVTRWMENLPSEQPGAPAGAQQQQQQQQQQQHPAAAAGGQPASMQFDAAGLSQFLASQPPPAAAQPPKQQAATDPRQKRATAAASAAAAATTAQQPSQQQPQPPPLPIVPAAPAGPPLPSPLPTALKPQQVSAMRTAAVQRILRATGNKPIRNFRELLLSRLASRAPASEGLTQLMLTHVLADYHRNRGHVLLVRWLYALAATVATSTPQQQQQQQDGEGQPSEEQETHTAVAGGGDKDMPDALPAAAAAAADAAAADGAAGDPAEAAAAEVPPSQPAVADVPMDDAPDLELARAAAEAAAAVAAAEAAQDRARAARRKGRAAAAAAAGGTAGDGAEAASSPAQQQDGQQQVEQGEQQHQHQHQQELQQEDGSVAGDSKQQQQQQQQPSSSNSSSSQADLSGTPYESVLLSSLQGLRETLPSTDPAIPRLLQDAPVLPLHAVTSFLQDLIAEGSDWAGVGLSAAYGLFESRPAARQALLQLLLDAAVSADSLARERAVGLIVSKLLAWEAHAATVLEFAKQHLLQLLTPPAAAEAGQEQQQQQQPDAAAAAAPEQQQGLSDAEREAADKAAKEAAAAAAVEAAAQHSMLYLSLCTVKPELLQLLLETYSKAGPSQRTALSRYAPSLALAIGPTAPELLRLVAQPPDEPSQQLLLTMLTALADAAPLPAALVQACTTPFKATGSVTLLDPVVAALNKVSVTKLLPDLLTQLPDGRLRLLYRRLGLAQHGQDAPLFAPVELLVLLHKVTSEPTMPQSVFKAHTKKVLEAVDRAMRTPEVFPAAVMQTAISRMEAMNPPPRLFMRSVAVMAGGGPGQARVAAPIAKWIISLLERLIQKQIWENKTQWRGFLLCCEKLQEQGSPLVLLQLPENILEQALGGVQPSLWKKLHDVVEAPNCPVVVYKGSRQVVNKFYERFLQKQIDDRQAEIAKAAAEKAAAAERAAAGAAAGGSGRAAAAAAAGEGQQQQSGRQSSSGDAGAKPKPQAAGSAPPGAAAASGAKQQQQGSDGSGQQRPDVGAGAAAAAAAAQPQTADPTQHRQEGGQGAVVDNEPDDEDDFVLDFEDE